MEAHANNQERPAFEDLMRWKSEDGLISFHNGDQNYIAAIPILNPNWDDEVAARAAGAPDSPQAARGGDDRGRPGH